METLEQIDKKIKTEYYLTSKINREIQIGSIGEFVDSHEFKILINEFQLDLLEKISNIEIDVNLNRVYVVNDLRFSISPKLY